MRRDEEDPDLLRFKLLIETLPHLVWVTTSEGVPAYMSPWGRQLLGIRVADLADWGWPDLLHPEDRERAQLTWKEAVDTGLYYRCEFRMRVAGGSYLHFLSQGVPVRASDGRVEQWIGSLTDIDELKRAKEEHARLEEQFRQAQKMEAIGRLAGGVAHDFNNLLTVINGYAELLLQSLDADDPRYQAAEQIQRAGERSASLTSQLLAFSRQQVIAPKVLDLNEILRGIEEMLRRLIGEDIELETALEPELGRVRADPGQVEQVVLNLAINARDAMPQGGKLRLETSNVELAEGCGPADLQPGEFVLLVLSDTGGGIAPEIRKQIFEPFFTTKERGKGTGLGLAVVHGIVRQSGGAIELSSEVGVGTTIRIYLPRVRQTVSRDKAAAAGVLPSGNETVLLVEDDEALRGLIQEILSDQGYHVLTASRGDQALDLAGQTAEPIHLLLTDVVMPGLGGRQVAEGVARLHPEVKVLYVSGYTDDAVIRHGVLQEKVSFLQKPFTTRALIKKLRDVLAL